MKLRLYQPLSWVVFFTFPNILLLISEFSASSQENWFNLTWCIFCHPTKQATTKINLAVERIPHFRCCKLSPTEAGHQLVGTIHIGSERYVRVACHLVISFYFKFGEVVETDNLLVYAQITANNTGWYIKLVFDYFKEFSS